MIQLERVEAQLTKRFTDAELHRLAGTKLLGPPNFDFAPSLTPPGSTSTADRRAHP